MTAIASLDRNTVQPFTLIVAALFSFGVPKATPDRPVLVDRFLEDATEVDVDCISDGETTVIGAIMEQIEEAGIHSGDSACVIPPFSLTPQMQDRIRDAASRMPETRFLRASAVLRSGVRPRSHKTATPR